MKCPEPIDLLIVTDWYLPGYKAGGPIVSIANLVKALRGHLHIGILCSDRDYLAHAPYPNIEANTWTRSDGVVLYYLSPAQQRYSEVAALLKANNPRILYINGLFSKSFSIYPCIAALNFDCRTIVAPRGMLAPGALGIKPFKKKLFLAFAKMTGLYRRTEWHATHSHEAAHIRQYTGEKVKITVLPNLPSTPTVNPADAEQQNPKVAGELEVLMVARIAPEKHIEFALNCLSLLPKGLKVRLIHVGPVYNNGYEKRLHSIALPQNVALEWCGALPPVEIETRYKQAHLFFLPSLGENYGHAIVEAMLHGIPALISDQTPWRQLKEQELGADFPLTSPSPFVDYLCQVAAMDQFAYDAAYGGIAKKITTILKVDEWVAAYKSYFK
jgi:glycosyltransferase involved in cell wall biosynthesis